MGDEITKTGGGSPDLQLVARLGAKARAARITANAATTRVAELEAENAKLKAENAKGDPSAAAGRVVELETQMRRRDQKDLFRKHATAAGASADDVDDLFDLAAIAADAPADDATIQAAVDAQAAKRPKFFTPAETAETVVTDPLAPKPKVPGPAVGKAGPAGVTPTVSEDLMKNDPAYVMRNWDRIQADAKAKVAARPAS